MAGVAQAIKTFYRLTTICFPAYTVCRHARCRVIRWSSDSVHSSNSTVLHPKMKIVDLPYNTLDKLISSYLGKYIIVTLCNATISLFSALTGLKHPHLKCEKHMYRWRAFESVWSELLKKDQSSHPNL